MDLPVGDILIIAFGIVVFLAILYGTIFLMWGLLFRLLFKRFWDRM